MNSDYITAEAPLFSPGVPVKIDLHVHTEASPCSWFPAHVMVEQALQRKLPVIVTTNHHDCLGDTEEIKKLIKNTDVKYFPGLELTCQWGDFLIFGENIEEFMPRKDLFPTHRLPREDVAVIWAHPFRFMRAYEVERIKKDVAPYIDAVEGINGILLRDKPRLNLLAQNMAREMNKPMTAGSDSHSFHSFFSIYTEFLTPIETYRDLVNALKQGKIKIPA